MAIYNDYDNIETNDVSSILFKLDDLLAQGVYLVTISSRDCRQTEKIVVMK